MRVLIVDDSPVWRVFVRVVLLRNGGFQEAEEAADGLEALERLRSGAYDLVVTDLSMPGMGGLALLQAVRNMDRRPPFLVMSSYRAEEMAGTALALGASAYLVKGVSPEKLAELARLMASEDSRTPEDRG